MEREKQSLNSVSQTTKLKLRLQKQNDELDSELHEVKRRLHLSTEQVAHLAKTAKREQDLLNDRNRNSEQQLEGAETRIDEVLSRSQLSEAQVKHVMIRLTEVHDQRV